MGKGLLCPKGGSYGGQSGRGGSMAGRRGSMAGRGGGWLAKRSIELNYGLGSGGLVFMDNAEECLDGCDRAGGAEVIGSGVDLEVIKSSSGEIPGETMDKRGGDMMGLGGGPV
ncbi:hypothetical protein Tco_1130007 [Tanacetum coccineum]